MIPDLNNRANKQESNLKSRTFPRAEGVVESSLRSHNPISNQIDPELLAEHTPIDDGLEHTAPGDPSLDALEPQLPEISPGGVKENFVFEPHSICKPLLSFSSPLEFSAEPLC